MPNELFVTLTKGDNVYIEYPAQGWLELFELGVNGSVIAGVWRGLKPDGCAAAPVVVRSVEFQYSGGKFKGKRPTSVATVDNEFN